MIGCTHSPLDENILKIVPVSVKKTLVKALVDDLNLREANVGKLPAMVITPTHAVWAMECVGQV